MRPAREVPGLDHDGFAPAAAIKGTASRLKLEDFVKIYRFPALSLEARDPQDEMDTPAPIRGLSPIERSFQRTTTHSGEARRYDARLAFLIKRPGNAFPDIISIGRATNNDIVLDLVSVSKVHGFFRREGDGWIYADNRSTNGTTWNGKVVKPGDTFKLTDGDKIGIGPELIATYRSPQAIHAWAHI
jgi:hypothetical protein